MADEPPILADMQSAQRQAELDALQRVGVLEKANDELAEQRDHWHTQALQLNIRAQRAEQEVAAWRAHDRLTFFAGHALQAMVNAAEHFALPAHVVATRSFDYASAMVREEMNRRPKPQPEKAEEQAPAEASPK